MLFFFFVVGEYFLQYFIVLPMKFYKYLLIRKLPPFKGVVEMKCVLNARASENFILLSCLV